MSIAILIMLICIYLLMLTCMHGCMVINCYAESDATVNLSLSK